MGTDTSPPADTPDPGVSEALQRLILSRAAAISMASNPSLQHADVVVGMLIHAITDTWGDGEHRRITQDQIASAIRTASGTETTGYHAVHPTRQKIAQAAARLEREGYIGIERTPRGSKRPYTYWWRHRGVADPYTHHDADLRVWTKADLLRLGTDERGAPLIPADPWADGAVLPTPHPHRPPVVSEVVARRTDRERSDAQTSDHVLSEHTIECPESTSPSRSSALRAHDAESRVPSGHSTGAVMCPDGDTYIDDPSSKETPSSKTTPAAQTTSKTTHLPAGASAPANEIVRAFFTTAKAQGWRVPTDKQRDLLTAAETALTDGATAAEVMAGLGLWAIEKHGTYAQYAGERIQTIRGWSGLDFGATLRDAALAGAALHGVRQDGDYLDDTFDRAGGSGGEFNDLYRLAAGGER